MSTLLLLDINLRNKIHFKDVIFIDGTGNDWYMGHLHSKRETQKMLVQNIYFKLNLHKIFSLNFINKIGKFGDIFRPGYMANIPGSNIKLDNYYNNIKFYEKYEKFEDLILQRALQRGIHYNFCGVQNKTVLYSDACDKKSKVFFPFLDENLIDHFEKRSVFDYDKLKMINKLSIRKYLDQNLNFNKISPKKGIFKATLMQMKFDTKQVILSKKIKIELDGLNKFQQSDFYLWSKFVINNNIDF